MYRKKMRNCLKKRIFYIFYSLGNSKTDFGCSAFSVANGIDITKILISNLVGRVPLREYLLSEV